MDWLGWLSGEQQAESTATTAESGVESSARSSVRATPGFAAQAQALSPRAGASSDINRVVATLATGSRDAAKAEAHSVAKAARARGDQATADIAGKLWQVADHLNKAHTALEQSQKSKAQLHASTAADIMRGLQSSGQVFGPAPETVVQQAGTLWTTAEEIKAASVSLEGKSLAFQLGYKHGKSQAKGGLKNIGGDTRTQNAISGAAAAEGLSVDDLTAMSIIESTGNRHVGTNYFGYTGLMQMGRTAAADVGMSYSSLVGSNNVENNAMAGAKYWNVNDKRLDKSVPRDPLHMYLAHQQGAGGTNSLMKGLQSNPGAAANRNQRNNLPPEVTRALGGTPSRQDFYDYWQGKMAAIQEAIALNKAN